MTTRADRPDLPAPLDVRDTVLELADLVEAVATAAGTSAPGPRVRTVPGSRVPPGAQAALDADETDRALAAVDGWTEFHVHVLLDEDDEVSTVPDGLPSRLRVLAAHVGHFLDHPDVLLAAPFGPCGELDDHLRALRRLARRRTRAVRTGAACQDPTCTGQYVAPLGGPAADRHDDALECDRCRDRVPYSVWSSWPRAHVEYVTVEHAARITGTTVAAVKMRAARRGWRRTGTGRDTRYRLDDVRDGERRDTRPGTR